MKMPGIKKIMEEHSKNQISKSNIKENILAMDDFQQVYKNNVSQMQGQERDRKFMVSRNMQKQKVESAELELMIEKITL